LTARRAILRDDRSKHIDRLLNIFDAAKIGHFHDALHQLNKDFNNIFIELLPGAHAQAE
jgi:chromosome segregation ATPase